MQIVMCWRTDTTKSFAWMTAITQKHSIPRHTINFTNFDRNVRYAPVNNWITDEKRIIYCKGQGGPSPFLAQFSFHWECFGKLLSNQMNPPKFILCCRHQFTFCCNALQSCFSKCKAMWRMHHSLCCVQSLFFSFLLSYYDQSLNENNPRSNDWQIYCSFYLV